MELPHFLELLLKLPDPCIAHKKGKTAMNIFTVRIKYLVTPPSVFLRALLVSN
jgi:hypothetical protein